MKIDVMPRTGRNSHGFKRVKESPGSNAAFRIVGIEGWRGVAAVLIVMTHVWTNMGTDGSGLGPGLADPRVAWLFGNIDIVVDLFFVLSGVLLWLPFARAMFDDAAPVPHGGQFLFRRVLRFIPLYWLIVGIVWFTRNYGIATADWHDLINHLLLIQAFDSRTIFYDIGPTWTLSVEWWFYVSLAVFGPAYVRWVRRGVGTARRVGRMSAGFGAVIWLSVAFKANVAWVWHIPADEWAWRFGPAAKADTFVIGMFLASAVVLLGKRKLPGWSLPLTLALAVACYWPVKVPPGVDHNLHFEVIRHTVASLAFALLLFGVMTTKWSWVPAAIDNKPLLRLSILAYTIYLVHEPVLLLAIKVGAFSHTPTLSAFLLNLAWVLALVVPAAWVCHRLVEEPWTDFGVLRDRRGRSVELYPHMLEPVRPAAAAPVVEHAVGENLRTRVLARVEPGAPDPQPQPQVA